MILQVYQYAKIKRAFQTNKFDEFDRLLSFDRKIQLKISKLFPIHSLYVLYTKHFVSKTRRFLNSDWSYVSLESIVYFYIN